MGIDIDIGIGIGIGIGIQSIPFNQVGLVGLIVRRGWMKDGCECIG